MYDQTVTSKRKHRVIVNIPTYWQTTSVLKLGSSQGYEHLSKTWQQQNKGNKSNVLQRTHKGALKFIPQSTYSVYMQSRCFYLLQLRGKILKNKGACNASPFIEVCGETYLEGDIWRSCRASNCSSSHWIGGPIYICIKGNYDIIK